MKGLDNVFLQAILGFAAIVLFSGYIIYKMLEHKKMIDAEKKKEEAKKKAAAKKTTTKKVAAKKPATKKKTTKK